MLKTLLDKKNGTAGEQSPAVSRPLTAQDILAIDDIEVQELYIPQWKQTVYLRTMTAADRGYLEEQIYSIDVQNQTMGAKIKTARMTALLAFLTLCDENGKRLFEQESQIDKLAAKSASAMNVIAEKAQAMAGMTSLEVKKLTGTLKNE